VGSASSLIGLGYGEIIPQNNPIYLSVTLQKIMTSNDLEVRYNQVNWENNDISWENFIKNAISKILPKSV
jgi:uncharacterized protein YpmS